MKARILEKSIPLGMIIFFVILIILRITNIFDINITGTAELNTEYIFGASGIGALAGIFSIIISISLMAVQFASQEYSHRIMNSYMKSFMLWTMIILYIGTMLFNLCNMVTIDPALANTRTSDVSLLLQILCFLMLIPHFVFTTAQLNPLYIIDKILYTVNNEYLLALKKYYIDGRVTIPGDLDRVLSVVEIVEKAIIKGDRDTTRTTVEKLYKSYQDNTVNGEPAWIRQYFMNYILRIGQQGILSEDDDIVVRSIMIIGEVGETAVGTATAIAQIDTLGTAALKKDYDVAVQQAIDSLLSIIKKSTNTEDITRIPGILRDLVDDLFKNNKHRIVNYLLETIAGNAAMIADKQNSVIAERCIDLLEKIGLAAAREGLVDISHTCILAYQKTGVAFVSRGITTYDTVSSSLLRIEYATNNELRAVRTQIDFVIRDIEKHAPKKVKEEIKPEKAPDAGRTMEIPPETDTGGSLDISGLWDKDDD